MCYQHTQVARKIEGIAAPYFVSLQRGSQTVGTCCFCFRRVTTGRGDIPAFYIRYFAFLDQFKRVAAGRRPGRRPSVLRAEIATLLETDTWAQSTGSYFHYAYVDPRNVRSVSLCRAFGFEKVRQYTTFIFTRFKLRSDAQPESLQYDALADIQQRLGQFYADYTMFSTENLFRDGQYFVLRDPRGQVVAGVQATPDRWQVHSLPGRYGKALLSVVSRIPMLNRVIGHQYRFLALEGLYYAEGCQNDLQRLVEALLAKYQVNSAITVVDRDSALCETLKTLDLGVVQKIMKNAGGDVICKFIQVPEEVRSGLRTRPAYISATDVT
ncbi:hypothetical protein [Dawidia soli]|uniref:Uncharacterized protein n=1 Tax=Dawidia soli TaxID=2782352 RepID=A0AAP2DAJ9_9BACT|nr:hypothetical protein [Dawidia soli]MBT1687075.1 hypothetical protein [Dawidia soli]